jgi:hypothetical protein
MNQSQVKAFAKYNFPKQIPIDLVVGILQIQFQQNSPTVLDFGLMDYLLK